MSTTKTKRITKSSHGELLFDRRAALGAFGALGGFGLLVWGCNHNGTGDGPDASTGGDGATGDAATGDTATGDGACAETFEGEVGPYFADDSASGFNRSNILSNLDGSDVQPGIPLTLTLYVYDSEKACAPYAGAQIDIWHCNSSGVYSDISGEGTSTQQWLRGYQITDSTGKVTFTTIVPGWYEGRTTHIHLRVRTTYSEVDGLSDGTNTTQVFFPQTLVDTIDTTITPYSAEGKNTTTNAGDRVYTDQTEGQNLLSLTGDTTHGFAATFAIYVPINDSTGGATGPGGSGGPGPGGA